MAAGMAEQKKLGDIAFIKTTMMVIMVLYHCFLFFGGNWFTPVEPAQSVDYLYWVARWMSTFHIQTFTIASGFFILLFMERKGTI